MFKNASIFKIKFPQPVLLAALNELAAAAEFIPCGASQDRSIGWVPPRGQEHGAMVEHIGGHLILRLMIETKSVPTQAIDDVVAAQVKKIETETGRKPGKKEKREIKDDARLALLPMAFSNCASAMVWIDQESGTMVVDSASSGRCDDVVTELVRLIDGVVVSYLNTAKQPSACMTMWLSDLGQLGADFSIGRAAILKATDESKAVVKYSRHSLDTDEVKQHIAHGKMATRLALTYRDRVSFTLTDTGVLTGLSFLDVVFDGRSDTAADEFDADVAILTGELTKLIPDLVEEMG